MNDFLYFKNNLCSFFNDPTQLIYSDENIALALRFALQEYSASLPHLTEMVYMLAQSGNEVELPQMTDVERVYKVHYPWDETKSTAEQAPNQVVRWSVDILADKTVLTIETSDAVRLQAGKQIRLLLGRQHAIEGLDNAEATTVPQAHFNLILQGGIGYLLLYTASNRGDILDKSLCERLAQSRLEIFRNMLAKLANQHDRSQAIVSWYSKNQRSPIY